MRESPAVKIIEGLQSLGAEVSFHDPHVAELPELGLESVDLAPAVAAADLVCVVTAHDGIDYDDLVDRPAEAIGRVYDAAGLAPPAPVDEFVAAYHAAHPRDAHGAHRYSPADFGIDPDDVRERFAFVNG